MNNPKVSIIVPIYNVERYLRRCINSLINQTLIDIEIILVDDESPDNCPIICDEYSNLDSRIKVVHKKNGGLGFARNSGLDISNGEYVAFVDSDDYVDLTMFEKLYDTAKKNSLDTVYCGYNYVSGNGEINSVSEVQSIKIFDTHEKVNNVLLDMIANEPSNPIERSYRMSVWHAIYSRKIIDNNNIRFCSEREFISEDIIFHIDYLTKAFNVAFIPDPLYNYSYNNASLTKVYREDRFEKAKILYFELMRKFLDLNLDNCDYKNRINRFLIGYARVSILGISKSKISFFEKRKQILKICNDKIWQKLKEYPVKKMPIKQKLVMIAIKYKMVNFILILFKIK